ncbi:MAG: protein kinase [Deltaproteobacteria bacterium]|nr:protein kinase [Deltaproteobacteria bacterium]
MTVTCSKCHGEFAVEDLYEGARCPNCKNVVELPGEFPTAPENARLQRADGRKPTAEVSAAIAGPSTPSNRLREMTERQPTRPAKEISVPSAKLPQKEISVRSASLPPRREVSVPGAKFTPDAPKTDVSSPKVPTAPPARVASSPRVPVPQPGSLPAMPKGIQKPADDVPSTLVEDAPQTDRTSTPLESLEVQLPSSRPRPAERTAPLPEDEPTPLSMTPVKRPVSAEAPPPAPLPEKRAAQETADLPMGRIPARRDGQSGPPGQDELTQSRTLGGYEIKRRLGQGGMGTVYLARQLSLDRDVAVKLLHPALANDAEFLTRFTREAYAAAHLTHHNIVQIFDIGSDAGTKFYSMEFVDGSTLGALVATKEKIDPEAAAGYVLQAARGLGYAHQQGIIHRDIKPDNLMLNAHGLIKVADLGLVKVDGLADPERGAEPVSVPKAVVAGNIQVSMGNVTNVKNAMGTPAFMSPEQAQDPSNVDGRADIYSLGCTLYYLLTGRPPFRGASDMATLYAHVNEPLVPPDQVVKRVPKQLSDIVVRMLAKHRDQRYQTMGEVAEALERFLGVDASKAFSPREEHAEQLESGVNEFNRSTWSRRRLFAALAFMLGMPIALGVAFKFLPEDLIPTEVIPTLAGGYLLTLAVYFVLHGVASHSYLFRLTRQFIFGSRIWVLLAWLAVLAGGGVLLYEYDLELWGLGALLGALALSVAFYFLVDRRVEKERRGAVEKVESLLKSLRLRGLEESALRQFVCKYSGVRWEEFYEALFGYDAKMEARAKWGRMDNGRPRKRFGVWRDPIIRFLEWRQQKRAEKKEQRAIAALGAEGKA